MHYLRRVMRRIAFFLVLTIVSLRGVAQETKSSLPPPAAAPSIETAAQQQGQESASDDEEYLNGMVPLAPYSAASTRGEVLTRPSLERDTLARRRYPHSYNRWASPYGWALHTGFNAEVDLSAFTSFGKHHFSGTAERISAMYAAAVGSHLSIAVGGYFTNMNTNNGNFLAVSAAAIISYRFNEHWEAYIYGQKNLVRSMSNNHLAPWNAMAAYDYFGNMSDRIGLGLRYNFNESTFIEVQFEYEKLPALTPQPPATMRPTSDNINRAIDKSNPHPTSAGGQR